MDRNEYKLKLKPPWADWNDFIEVVIDGNFWNSIDPYEKRPMYSATKMRGVHCVVYSFVDDIDRMASLMYELKYQDFGFR